MRREVIATVWVVGSIVPVGIATVFFLGCCVLPFHQVLHKIVPLCSIASWGASVNQNDGDRHPLPAPQKKDETATKSVPTKLSARFAVTTDGESERFFAMARTEYRTVISLGAVRCDDDVGMRLSLLDTFRI